MVSHGVDSFKPLTADDSGDSPVGLGVGCGERLGDDFTPIGTYEVDAT